MLSNLSITSLDQGRLFPKATNEDVYYARFMTVADEAEPSVQQKPRTRNFLGFPWGGLLAIARR